MNKILTLLIVVALGFLLVTLGHDITNSALKKNSIRGDREGAYTDRISSKLAMLWSKIDSLKARDLIISGLMTWTKKISKQLKLFVKKHSDVLRCRGVVIFSVGCIAVIILYGLRVWRTLLRNIYTFEHEIAHVLAGKLFGARFVAMQVTSHGGSATMTRNNIFIRLAPYFMPIFCYLALSLSFLVDFPYRVAFLACAGFFYGNFIIQTVSTINGQQPDISRSGGKLVCYPLIFVANMGAIVGICLLSAKLIS